MTRRHRKLPFDGDASSSPSSTVRAKKPLFNRSGFSWLGHLILAIAVLATAIICICLGSVNVPVKDTVDIIIKSLFGLHQSSDPSYVSIIMSVRLPRVMCAALVGAALSLCGCAMQGLLKNPLADGSTLGVSSGASLGAVIAIAFDITIPFLPLAGTMVMSMIFAFASLIIILLLAYKLDHSLSTNTIILLGVIYSMFVSSIISLIITFASSKVKHITFWTMGSLSGSNYKNVIVLLAVLIVCGIALLRRAPELNAFAVGEDNARSIGVDIRRVKLEILISVSVLIGVCVSIGGTIGFVGLVIPHIIRMITGPNHKSLLPASVYFGAIFLMLADLAARTIASPAVLPIGVVTSLVGAVVFVFIFFRSRKGA